MLALNGWMQTPKAGDLAPTLPAANQVKEQAV